MEIELNSFAWGKKNSSLKKINVPCIATIKHIKASTAVSSHLIPSLKCYRVDEKLYFDDKRLIADNLNIPIIQLSIQTTLIDDDEAKTVEELFNPNFLIDTNQVHLIFAWELTDENLLNSGNNNDYFLNVDDFPPSYEAGSSNFEHNMSHPTTHAANVVIPILDRGNSVIDANGGEFLKSASESHPLLAEQNEYPAGAITSNNTAGQHLYQPNAQQPYSTPVTKPAVDNQPSVNPKLPHNQQPLPNPSQHKYKVPLVQGVPFTKLKSLLFSAMSSC
ncbi:hypothetical protein HK099_006757 [Clydaea vesicula]|uniref:Uncharacterized protein n=1 Tax=Clydaea vesicula TaxID=447962 RepID=A0AAD5Y0T4_9FUNG|nr:hypothetical protein HK099_006757 [Clydaea vesicula]